ncbi:MATE family efflux transporter [Devosia pacifica]|uniref:MATE family efflux transporter n=2 Tax=Devosia pacifica TaxID=1335967 RepID=A0A918SC54_9HYPH|nr:MATE family efflux transporter [Devosia pacifica]
MRPQYPFRVRHADVWRIALPACIAFITEPLAGLVDMTVIGRLGDASLLGGVVLGALVFNIILSLAYFLRIGTAGLTAQAIGARDPADGLLHAVRALLVGGLIGIGMIVLAVPLLMLSGWLLAPGDGVREALADYFYIRVWGAPFSLINFALLGWFYGRAEATTGMILQFIIHGINIAGSIVLVQGLGLGVEGAALGTVLGQIGASIIGLMLMLGHYGGLGQIVDRVRLGELFQRVALKRMFGLSRDLMIRSIALQATYAYFAAQGSRMGDIELAANAILLNLLFIIGFFMDGIAQAAEQLSGKALGANWQPAFEEAYRLSMIWGLIIAIVMGFGWYFFGPYIISLMTTRAPVQAYAVQFLGLAALCSLTFMPAFVFDGILVGTTQNVVMRNGMIASLVVFVGVAWLAQPLYGNTGLWLALHAWFIARGIIYWWALRRIRSRMFAQ